jgi:hypothetical protein
MLKRNLFDEAARVLAMPIPRRKAFKYVATGFAGALLSFLWPKGARATNNFTACTACPGCVSDGGCFDKIKYSSCTTGGGQTGYCKPTTYCYRGTGSCCTCTAR